MRMRKIQSLSRDAKFDKDPWLNTFGIHVDMRLVDFDGRILPPPKLQYGGGNRAGVSSIVFDSSETFPNTRTFSGRCRDAARRSVAIRRPKVLRPGHGERIRSDGCWATRGRPHRAVSLVFVVE